MSEALRIRVTGLIGQHPRLGGMTWHYLHYLLGLRRLGHDVYYMEDSGEWPYNLDGGPSGDDYVAADCEANVAFLERLMTQFDLNERWGYRCPITERWFGRRPPESVDLTLNLSGTLARPEEYRDKGTLAYIDTDPVFTQLRLARGDIQFRQRVDAHDVHFSFGECLDKFVPQTGHRWLPTRQPVVLSEWGAPIMPRKAFTTVMNWASYACETYDGRTYGQKDVEFARFLALARCVAPVELEIAVRGTRKGHLPGADEETRTAEELRTCLRQKGWRVVDPITACGDFEAYRHHIQSSKAEWTVAKNAYVTGRPGWFSDRSACYLASGRPVVAQETGFSNVLPVGEGLLTFTTLEQAIAAIRDVEGSYERHARAARDIAQEYFASDKVLDRLIEVALTWSPAEVRI